MRTTPALIALALAATLTACGEDDGTVTVSPPPATVTVTEEPVLTDLPPPEPEPRLLNLAEVCEAWSDLPAPTDFDSMRVLDHVDRVDALLEVAEPPISQTFEPLRQAYFAVVDAEGTSRLLPAMGGVMTAEHRQFKKCYGFSPY